MYNLTQHQLAKVKQQAINELLEEAKSANVAYNMSVISINEPDRVIPFTEVPVRLFNTYLTKLKDTQ